MKKILLLGMAIGLTGSMAMAQLEDSVDVSVNILEGGSYVQIDSGDVDFGDITLDGTDKYIISDALQLDMFAANAPWHVRIGFGDSGGLTNSEGDIIKMKYWREDFGPDPSTYTGYPDPDTDPDWWWVETEGSDERKAKRCWRWINDITDGNGVLTDMIAWYKDSPYNPQTDPDLDPPVDPADYESVKSGAFRIGFEASEIAAGSYDGVLKVKFELE